MSTIWNVNLDDLPDSDVIPAGQYRLRIDGASEPKPDKNGIPYIGLVYTVIDGEFAGRKLSENYIPLEGRALLKRIARAAGYKKNKLASGDDLIGLELDAVVRVRNSEEFGEQNVISVYIQPSDASVPV